MLSDKALTELLQQAKTVAVVGISNNPARASFGVARFLQRQGYRIIPVNPGESEVLGERCYPSLQEVPDAIDIVDIFRRSETVLPVVEEALEKTPRLIWMQEGVINAEAKTLAESHGIPVIMDRCLLKELARLLPAGSKAPRGS